MDDISFSQLRKQHKNVLILKKAGCFYRAYGADAEKLNQLYGYQICVHKYTKYAGFPEWALEGILNDLECHSESYIVVDGGKISDQWITRKSQELTQKRQRKISTEELKRRWAERALPSNSKAKAWNEAASCLVVSLMKLETRELKTLKIVSEPIEFADRFSANELNVELGLGIKPISNTSKFAMKVLEHAPGDVISFAVDGKKTAEYKLERKEQYSYAAYNGKDRVYFAIRKHISNFLSSVDRDLTNMIEKDRSLLCLRKSIEYACSPREYPKYDNPVIQAFYYLRYYAAYFTQYFYMYQRALRFMHEPTIHVLSLGCGNAIDFQALYYANLITEQERPIKYIGVDASDWHHKEICLDDAHSIRVFQETIGEQTTSDEFSRQAQACNIIIFPMSIFEISRNSEGLYAWLAKFHFSASCIIALIPWPVGYGANGIETIVAGIIRSICAYGGFRLLMKPIVHTINEVEDWDEDTRLDAIVPGFQYPNRIKKSWQRCAEDPNCSTKCKSLPMEYTRYMKYELIRLEKVK